MSNLKDTGQIQNSLEGLHISCGLGMPPDAPEGAGTHHSGESCLENP